jgi:hypothetical protein
MSANSYGIIVEGEYDSGVYETIVRRLAGDEVYIRAFVCRGKPALLQKFPGYLEALKIEVAGGPVDMAVVIADADGTDPLELETKMRSKVEGRNYPFRLGVRFHAVRNAMEAWLLADVSAISKTMERRRPGRGITKSHDAPEGLLDPKPTFRRLLAENELDYTPAVGAEIAQQIDFQLLSDKCPRFRLFADLVDC